MAPVARESCTPSEPPAYGNVNWLRSAASFFARRRRRRGVQWRLSAARTRRPKVCCGENFGNAAMFVTFFHELKSAGLPVTLREYLTLMEAMEADLASRRV